MPQFPIYLVVSSDDAGQRLDQYLATQLSDVTRSEISRSRVQQLIAKGEVLVNGAAASCYFCLCRTMSPAAVIMVL